MKTQILQSFDLRLAVEALKNSQPVIFPTETVYGLGAPVFDVNAIKKIFEIKGRPQDNPLIAHIGSIEEAARLGEGLDTTFFMLASAFWPGPLSIIVRKKIEVPSIVSAGHSTIAIRMPAHPIARNLIQLVGTPLVAPSANLSGKPSPTCLSHCLDDLDGTVPFAIDGGDCDVGIESTVLSLISNVPTILRPGSITKKDLEKVLGQAVSDPPLSGPILSPGMKYKHYAPKARVRLIFKKDEISGPYFIVRHQTLYSLLRDADRQNLTEIQIYCDEETRDDAALMNRLLRASGQII